jgi:twinkle protein
MIAQSVIETIRDTVRIEDVISEFVNLKKSGTNYESCCPFHDEKTPSFKVSPAKGVYKCFGCGVTGNSISFVMDYLKIPFYEAVKRIASKNSIIVEEIKPKKEYKKPEYKPITDLSKKLVSWFSEKRGITEQTLKDFKISEGVEYMPQVGGKRNTIHFNYFIDGELINIKYRDSEKNFKLSQDAELVMYNLDSIRNKTSVIITEGEIDAMSFHQAGYKNVISVPNGANKSTNNLKYLDNYIDLFNDKDEIIIATDNDLNGKKLRDDLAIRFGIERCYKVDFGDCKDANELLVRKGIQGFIDLIQNKKEYPVQGIFSSLDISDDIDEMYSNGLPDGCGIGMDDFDNLLKFHKGYITTVTGIPGHGKSAFIDFLSIRLNLLHGWKFAFYSPENHPMHLHFSTFAEKLIGKPFSGHNKINLSELNMSKKYFSENFFFIKPDEDVTLDNILKMVKTLVKRKGIDAFVIDAWNKLDHQYTDSETRYISQQLDKLNLFCEMNNVHLFLAAHPTKMTKQKDSGKFEVANLYSISGSANFFNKTANGLSVYRNFEEDNKRTDVYVQKVKFKHWGSVGMASFNFDRLNSRYYTDRIDYTNWIKQDEVQNEIRYDNKIIQPIPEKPKDDFIPLRERREKTFIDKNDDNDEVPF